MTEGDEEGRGKRRTELVLDLDGSRLNSLVNIIITQSDPGPNQHSIPP
jgi:hypothetical protein